MNISNNVSSLQAHQTMINGSANNVANLNSDGYIPTDTRIIGGDESIKAQNRRADNSGSKTSQTDLAKEIPDQIIAQESTALNVTAIKTQDEMLGSLLDIKA